MSNANILQERVQAEINELTSSISGMVESFKKLQEPLVESHQQVPRATNQLDKISTQTEAATHQMLDTIEQVSQRQEEIIEGLQKITKLAEESSSTDILNESTQLTEKAQANLNDAYVIMDSLQFQDITSQQMDHAASLLEGIEGKLRGILSDLGSEPEIQENNEEKKVRAYDPNADMVDKKTNQDEIDSLFNTNGQ